MNFKEIHIGKLIQRTVMELEIDTARICNYFKCDEGYINSLYETKNIDVESLLRWSKLLDYDFFRIYSHHLLLYSSATSHSYHKISNSTVSLPAFRKNIYSKEIIDFVLEQIREKRMTVQEVLKTYRIPKTTLYKWIIKYEKY